MVVSGAANERGDGLLDGAGRCIDDNTFPFPRTVVAMEDVLPGGPARVCDMPAFHTSAMFSGITAHELDLEDANVKAVADLAPCIARQRPRVDTVGDDGSAKLKIVRCDRLRDFVPDGFNRKTCSEHWSLNRVDPQVDRTQFSGREACDR